MVGRFFVGILLQDICGEYREEHHAQRGEHHAEYLADGRHGEYLGPDRRDVHPRPPQRVAEAVELVVHEDFVIVKNQRRNVRKDDHGEDVGDEQLPDFVVHEPLHHDVKREERPHQRHDADQHRPVAGQFRAAPIDDVQVGDRDQEHEDIAGEETAFAFRGGPPYEEIAQEEDTDCELDNQVGARKMHVVAADDLPRDGCKQDYSRDYFEDTQAVSDFCT